MTDPPIDPTADPPTAAPADPPADPQPERRRPVGGAAAWRRYDVPPTRAADDDRREAARYPRAPWPERLREGVNGASRNRAAVALAILVLGGFVFLRLATPEVVRFEALQAGDCLYVRAGDPDGSRPIGPEAVVRERVRTTGAERAPCELSHSHEVARVIPLDDAGDPWPGDAALAARVEPACAEPLAQVRATRPPSAPAIAVTIVMSNADQWAGGIRQAVCLVHREDGAFLAGRTLRNE